MMPKQYGQHHDQYLQKFAASRTKLINTDERRLYGLGRNGYMFPIYLQLHKAFSSLSEDLMILASIRKQKTRQAPVVCTCNRQGYLSDCSAGFEKLLTRRRRTKEIAEKNIADIIPEFLNLTNLYQGKGVTQICMVKRQDGSTLTMKVTCDFINFPEKPQAGYLIVFNRCSSSNNNNNNNNNNNQDGGPQRYEYYGDALTLLNTTQWNSYMMKYSSAKHAYVIANEARVGDQTQQMQFTVPYINLSQFATMMHSPKADVRYDQGIRTIRLVGDHFERVDEPSQFQSEQYSEMVGPTHVKAKIQQLKDQFVQVRNQLLLWRVALISIAMVMVGLIGYMQASYNKEGMKVVDTAQLRLRQFEMRALLAQYVSYSCSLEMEWPIYIGIREQGLSSQFMSQQLQAVPIKLQQPSPTNPTNPNNPTNSSITPKPINPSSPTTTILKSQFIKKLVQQIINIKNRLIDRIGHAELSQQQQQKIIQILSTSTSLTGHKGFNSKTNDPTMLDPFWSPSLLTSITNSTQSQMNLLPQSSYKLLSDTQLLTDHIFLYQQTNKTQSIPFQEFPLLFLWYLFLSILAVSKIVKVFTIRSFGGRLESVYSVFLFLEEKTIKLLQQQCRKFLTVLSRQSNKKTNNMLGDDTPTTSSSSHSNDQQSQEDSIAISKGKKFKSQQYQLYGGLVFQMFRPLLIIGVISILAIVLTISGSRELESTAMVNDAILRVLTESNVAMMKHVMLLANSITLNSSTAIPTLPTLLDNFSPSRQHLQLLLLSNHHRQLLESIMTNPCQNIIGINISSHICQQIQQIGKNNLEVQKINNNISSNNINNNINNSNNNNINTNSNSNISHKIINYIIANNILLKDSISSLINNLGVTLDYYSQHSSQILSSYNVTLQYIPITYQLLTPFLIGLSEITIQYLNSQVELYLSIFRAMLAIVITAIACQTFYISIYVITKLQGQIQQARNLIKLVGSNNYSNNQKNTLNHSRNKNNDGYHSSNNNSNINNNINGNNNNKNNKSNHNILKPPTNNYTNSNIIGAINNSNNNNNNNNNNNINNNKGNTNTNKSGFSYTSSVQRISVNKY